MSSNLAIHGGNPVRSRPMPSRIALGPAEQAMITECLEHYNACGVDPGYQDVFETRYTDLFVSQMGGGYADAVATGTAALYVAIAALGLPAGAQVLCSPITDPGTLSAIILNRLVPKMVDAAPGSFNIGPEQFAARIGPEVAAAVVVHSAGQACDIESIIAIARQHGIKVVEDCSQAHMARWRGRLVGTFGDIAAFSTMYRKASITGGSGGVVYSSDLDLFRMALAHADRGKAVWVEGFDWRDPHQFLFPALNLHTDEISSAIGISSLRRIEATRLRRLAVVAEVTGRLREKSRACRASGYTTGDSPFIYPIYVDSSQLSCDKVTFAEAVRAEGIPLNPHYQYCAATWPFLKPYLADSFDTPNARASIDSSFALYLTETYGEDEARDMADAILKVEKHFLV